MYSPPSDSAPDIPGIGSDPSISPLLKGIGLALALVFLAAVLSAVLPPRLFDSQWQLLLASALVNNAAIAVLAGVLLRLGMTLDPASRPRWWRRLRRACLPLVLLFLLLVPLQPFAAWTYQRTLTSGQQQQAIRSGQRLHDLRQIINTASSTDQLDSQLGGFSGEIGELTQEQRRLPLPELKQELGNRADALADRLLQQVESQSRNRPDVLIRESVRIALSALGYAISFALIGGIDLPGGGPTGPSRAVVDEDYFRHLAS